MNTINLSPTAPRTILEGRISDRPTSRSTPRSTTPSRERAIRKVEVREGRGARGETGEKGARRNRKRITVVDRSPSPGPDMSGIVSDIEENINLARTYF